MLGVLFTLPTLNSEYIEDKPPEDGWCEVCNESTPITKINEEKYMCNLCHGTKVYVEESFGLLEDTPAIIKRSSFESEDDIKKEIKSLAEEYDVNEDKISYYIIIGAFEA